MVDFCEPFCGINIGKTMVLLLLQLSCRKYLSFEVTQIVIECTFAILDRCVAICKRGNQAAIVTYNFPSSIF